LTAVEFSRQCGSVLRSDAAHMLPPPQYVAFERELIRANSPDDLTARSREVWDEAVGVKALVRIRPYLREGRPVTSYMREIERDVSWKPTMTPEEADAWSAGSAIRQPLQHVTVPEQVPAITSGGFIIPKKTTFGRLWGNGVYMTLGPESTHLYENMPGWGSVSMATLDTRVNVKNPAQVDVTDMPHDQYTPASEARRWVAGKLGLSKEWADWELAWAKKQSEQMQLEEAAQRAIPTPFPAGHPIWHKRPDWADLSKDPPELREAYKANVAAGAKQKAWLLDHGWDPSFEDTGRSDSFNQFLQEQGHDALVITDRMSQHGYVDPLDYPRYSVGGNQVVVFDPRQVTVVKH
jgi:hypothetical protein